MKIHFGFTIVETLTLVTLIAIGGLLFVQQSEQIGQLDRDRHRKVAVNAFYFSLEEVYHATNSSYPREINSKNLPSVDPALFKDPNGVEIGLPKSNYSYEGLNCDGNSCRSFVVKAVLEAENEFIKQPNR